MPNYGKNKNGIPFKGRPNRSNRKNIGSLIKLHQSQVNDPEHILGLKNEQKFFRAFKNSNFVFPDYYVAIQKGSAVDDIYGVDFYLQMREGVSLPVNVKSSLHSCFQYKDNQKKLPDYPFRRFILTFVVFKKYSQKQVLTNFFKQVEIWRDELLEQFINWNKT